MLKIEEEKKLNTAYVWAEYLHKKDCYDVKPYMTHIDNVLSVGRTFRLPIECLIACCLHDSIEMGHTTYQEIKKRFGLEIAEIVYDVTDELGRNRAERFGKTCLKTKSNWKNVVVKLCDRIANVSYSKNNVLNPSKFNMYSNEKYQFFTGLYSTRHNEKTNEMWDYLKKQY